MGDVVTILRENGDIVCRRCTVADRPLARMRGLLGRRMLDPEEGILLRPASSIHTWFMHFPIDAVFLDGDLAVMATKRDLSPWNTARARRARAVLELPAGACEAAVIRPGERLIVSANNNGGRAQPGHR
jgi:uncharacterized membrane protein (UPF0127 family)